VCALTALDVASASSLPVEPRHDASSLAEVKEGATFSEVSLCRRTSAGLTGVVAAPGANPPGSSVWLAGAWQRRLKGRWQEVAARVTGQRTIAISCWSMG